MTRTRTVRYAAAVSIVAAAGLGLAWQQTAAAQGRGNTQVPRLEVDPLWPKPFPYDKHWALGSVTGVAVDGQDHVWVSNRGTASLQANEKGPTLTPWASECCFGAPQILEFDAEGTLLNSWGGPGQGYVWPQNPAGIAVDAKGNVWIAAGGLPTPAAGGGRRGAPPAAVPGGAPGAGRAAAGAAPAAGADAAAGGGRAGRGGRGGGAAGAAPAGAPGGAPGAAAAQGRGGAAPGAGAAPATPAVADAHVIKFDRNGKALMTIGTPGKTDESDTTLDGPQAIAIDDAANEVYVADSGHKRVIVFDANSGAFKRKWSANGEPFKDVSCVRLAKDGMVYVCDSANNRIQVFQKDGKFVKEGKVKEGTGGMVLNAGAGAQGATYSFGSVWDIAFSNDAQQRFLYVADGMNKTVWVVQRDTLTPVSRIGDGGRYPGTFYAVGSVAVDSKGNLYTGEESDGKRVQKFLNKGMTAPRALD